VIDNETLCTLHATIMSLPFQAGYSPQQWQLVTDLMLEKTPGSPKVHRLRVIQLYESNMNQGCCILINRQLGHIAEDHNNIKDMQYGSHLGKICLTPVLNKKLIHDLFWQTKKTGTTLDNDAK